MNSISITADAGTKILSQLMSGELYVFGIEIRETASKRIRYHLQGLQDFPADASKIAELPALAPLRAAISVQQLLGVIAVAQNAATAATLKRIEGKLDAIDQRLDGIEHRLTGIETNVKLVLGAMRDFPISRLKAAKNAAVTALRTGNTTALIGATKDAEQAARDILAQARHLVSVEQSGVPFALRCPREMADLVSGAAEAMLAASAMHLSLGSGTTAANVMHEVANTIEHIRSVLGRRLSDPELMLRRIEGELAPYYDLEEAASQLRESQKWTRARALMIEAGVFGPEPSRVEFEAVAPVGGIGFLEVEHRPAELQLQATLSDAKSNLLY